MFRTFFFSLRARLLLLVLLAVIPALTLILYTTAGQKQAAIANAREDARWFARLVAGDQERLIAETRQLLLTLAHLSEVRAGNTAVCNSLFSKLLKQYPQYINLGVVSSDGELICSALPGSSSLNLANRPDIRQAILELSFSVGNYQVDEITGIPAVHFAYPVLDENYRVQSIIFVALSLDWLNQIITTSQLPDGASLLLIDRNSVILVHHPQPDIWVGKSLPEGSELDQFIRTGGGSKVIMGVDNIERLYIFTPLGGATRTGFYLGAGISETIIFKPANQILQRYFAGMAIVFFLALAAAWIGGDFFILGRVRALLYATNQVASGDLNVRTGLEYRQGEIGELARSFDQMTEALKERETERRLAENALLQQNRALSASNTIAATISSLLELPEILESMKRLFIEELNVPGGIIYFYDDSEDLLYVEAAWGVPAAVLSKIKRFPASQFHYEPVVRENKPFLSLEFRRVLPFSRLGLELARPNWKSYICVPLLSKGHVYGALDLFSLAPDRFGEYHLNLFAALGQQVGVAIHNAHLFEQVRTGRQQLQLLSQQLLGVQEAERRHIARELHDEIGQGLTAVKVNLQSVMRLTQDTQLGLPLDESVSIVERTLQQVRNLSLDLRPSLLDDLGVVAALRWYADRQAQRAGFEAKFLSDLDDHRLPADLETTCFRVVQEALTNVVRHAQAKRVWIDLRQVENTIELTIRDDGIGFNVEAIIAQAAGDLSLGILGMQERIQLIGGEFSINSDPNQGTRIRAIFPIEPDPNLSSPLTKRGAQE